MSWNVFLRPGIMNDGQLDRCDSISTYLSEQHVDVIVLQEAFHRKSRRRIIKKLKPTFPFHTHVGKRSFWGVSSGVLVFSKNKIDSSTFVAFDESTGADKLARKGVFSTLITKGKKRFQLISTHLQAGGSRKERKIREKQIAQCAQLTTQDSSIVTIFSGDFNVATTDDSHYSFLLNTLNANNHSLQGNILHTANFNDQNLFETTGTPKWIDFILLKDAKKIIQHVRSWIEAPRMIKASNEVRMSDHNPIFKVISW